VIKPQVRQRVYGAATAILLTAVLFVTRISSAPSASGFRHAIAPAPGGALYAVQGGHALRVDSQGRVVRLGATGGALPLTLAADGQNLVLGTDSGVAVSQDGGATWRQAHLPRGHYPAVGASGSTLLAGQWAGEIWLSQDAGDSWRSIGAPGGGEYQAFAVSIGSWYAATLTGVWVTADAGHRWSRTALPSRVTALETSGLGVIAGDWRGDVYAAEGVATSQRIASLGAGIWALNGSLIATTDGIRGGRGLLLAGKEISALVSAGDSLYAGIAGGPVLVSWDAGRSWHTVLQG
jgi:hypothetical protein